MNSELIELISKNHDLPIFAFVSPDVVQDDSHYWAGKIRNGEIREYVELDYSYKHVTDCDWLFKDDTEEWEEYMLENYLANGLSEDDANKKIQEELNSLKFKKAIFVYVKEF